MKYLTVFILLILVSCASSPTQKLLRTQVYDGNFSSAKETLEKSDIKLEQRNKFLYYLEKGQLSFLEENYLEASVLWEKARELLKSYYRKKLTDKVLAGIANSNYEDFHGEVFEQHQFFFHLSLAYLRISQLKNTPSREKVRTLMQARAVLLDWDSFIKSLESNGVKAFYRESFLARFYASLLHEVIGSREDLQIAFQLMKDAKNLMEFKNFQVLGDHIKQMLGESLVRLAKKLGRKKETRLFSSSYKINLEKIDMYPVILIIDRGQIAEKEAIIVPFGLQQALDCNSKAAGTNLLNIGMTVLSGFSNGVLGLGYERERYQNSTYIRYLYNISSTALELEMPVRAEKGMVSNTPLNLVIDDNENRSGPKTITPDFFFSISELSKAAIDNDFEDIYFRTGMRSSMKYLTAIIGSYKLYQSMTQKQKNNQTFEVNGFASLAASASFALAVAGIKASEKADIRYWSTLPDHLLIKELTLGLGNYSITYKGNKVLEFEKKPQRMELFSVSIRN
jgi:hypothetical protein